MLETMEATENGHVETGAFSPRTVVESIAQLKCIYTNAHSMGMKQEELEVTVQQENYDLIAIRKDRQGRW